MERQILAKILKDRPFQLVLQFRKSKSQEMNPFRPSFELLFLYVLLELEASAHKWTFPENTSFGYEYKLTKDSAILTIFIKGFFIEQCDKGVPRG